MATLRATANVNANNLTTQQSLSTQIISSLTVTQGGILNIKYLLIMVRV